MVLQKHTEKPGRASTYNKRSTCCTGLYDSRFILKAHPVSLVRSGLYMLDIKTCYHIDYNATDGQLVKVARLV